MTKTIADDCRALTDNKLDLVTGGVTNAETPLGAVFMQGFLNGGGCLELDLNHKHVSICKDR